MASENIMMDAVRRGGDRQVLHEEIRKMSIEAGRVVKEEGGQNNLLELIAQNPMFGMSLKEISAHMDPSLYIGRCPQQVDEFLTDFIQPKLDKYAAALKADAVELTV